MQYPDFLIKIKEIKSQGFVPTHRLGDTGIGKTLEDLLGIEENNIAGPDFSRYELKSARKNSNSMLTLFTKAPSPLGANAELLRIFGYKQRKNDSKYHQIHFINKEESKIPEHDKELHVTLDSIKPNSVGLKLDIRGNRIYIANDQNVEAYWDRDMLKISFEKKYHNLVYVLADSKLIHGNEHFHFNEAYLLQDFSYEKFTELVRRGLIKGDLRMGHYSDGRPHDHGTGFRVFQRYLPECFENIVKIL